MKILFNCSTNNIGGGIKNSAIFIKYAIENKKHTYFFAISPQVKNILEQWSISTDNMYLFKSSPARNKKERKHLFNLANKLNVDIVFTMAGPAYIRFKQTHVMGISNPYITHADFQALTIGKNLRELVKVILLIAYQAFYAQKADYWIFQTDESRNGFINRYFVNKNKTNVISNSIGNEFINHYKSLSSSICNLNDTITIFTPAAGYLHKVLHLIPMIAKNIKLISDGKYKFKFLLTIDFESDYWSKIQLESKKLLVEDYIENIGSYNYSTVLKLFDKSDLIFVPSILETFSASYLEAFASKRPLIVADKGFARDICKDAAIYINPFDEKESAKKIDALIKDVSLQKKLVNRGEEVIKHYGTQEQRIKKIINYLENLKGEK